MTDPSAHQADTHNERENGVILRKYSEPPHYLLSPPLTLSLLKADTLMNIICSSSLCFLDFDDHLSSQWQALENVPSTSSLPDIPRDLPRPRMQDSHYNS